jgi:hypothetical protein
MTATRAFIILAVSIVTFSIGGLGIGALIGKISPEYYRAFFTLTPDADTVSFGSAIGLAQGAVMGFVAALVIIPAVTWYRIRQSSKSSRTLQPPT